MNKYRVYVRIEDGWLRRCISFVQRSVRMSKPHLVYSISPEGEWTLLAVHRSRSGAERVMNHLSRSLSRFIPPKSYCFVCVGGDRIVYAQVNMVLDGDPDFPHLLRQKAPA